MIVIDTGVLLAYFAASDPDHRSVVDFLDSTSERLVTTPLVLAELDYFVLDRFGPRVEARVLQRVIDSNMEILPFGAHELYACVRILDRYRDLELGLTDASVIAAADASGTLRIATLDIKDFGAVAPVSGGSFELLPRR